MLNEWQEFLDYTETVSYTAKSKNDTSYMGRFTFTTILEFKGLTRVLTIIARRYMFHDADGNIHIIKKRPSPKVYYLLCLRPRLDTRYPFITIGSTAKYANRLLTPVYAYVNNHLNNCGFSNNRVEICCT